MTSRFVLAQANWARMVAPIDAPPMRGFVEQLDGINALAEASPGFVWRYIEGDDEPSFFVIDDEAVLFNMSTWESIAALEQFTYRSGHAQVLRDRGRWFHTPDRAPMVLWWQPRAIAPTPAVATERFEALWEHGATPAAFHFRTQFPPPDDAAG